MKTNPDNQNTSMSKLPICVDLDGTLVHSDTLINSITAALTNISLLIKLPFWLTKGKAGFKSRLAQAILPNVQSLPYNAQLIHYLKKHKNQDHPLVLVTAANCRIAHAVNTHLALFDDVMASDDHTNLRGREKADALINRFGKGRFIYAGNDTSDLHVWRVAYSAILVNASRRLVETATTLTRIEAILPYESGQQKLA